MRCIILNEWKRIRAVNGLGQFRLAIAALWILHQTYKRNLRFSELFRFQNLNRGVYICVYMFIKQKKLHKVSFILTVGSHFDYSLLVHILKILVMTDKINFRTHWVTTEREKGSRGERETSMGCLVSVPWPGITPVTFFVYQMDNTPNNWTTQPGLEMFIYYYSFAIESI